MPVRTDWKEQMYQPCSILVPRSVYVNCVVKFYQHVVSARDESEANILRKNSVSSKVFRTDLITAMKIPDHQIVTPGAYFDLSDPWKQEWEKGVQVVFRRQTLYQLFKLVDQMRTVWKVRRNEPSVKLQYNKHVVRVTFCIIRSL